VNKNFAVVSFSIFLAGLDDDYTTLSG